MNFTEAYGLEIGKYVEKKGKFSYLSWCYAVRFLREHFPAATWRVCENEKGLPLFSMDGGHFVKIELLLGEGESFTQWMPVLNAQNKPIPSPTVFDINTSIQRGLTKCIAMATGIGLGLYAGEDLPGDEKESKGGTTSQSFARWLIPQAKRGWWSSAGAPQIRQPRAATLSLYCLTFILLPHQQFHGQRRPIRATRNKYLASRHRSQSILLPSQ